MAIFGSFQEQIRSVIQWQSESSNTLFYRWSGISDEIKNASKLIVGPTQGCIFVYEGRVQTVFNSEGVFDIETSNIPFITTIKKFMQNFESEHKAEFYFYKKSIVPDQKWGTTSPIKYLDPIYKFPVELVAFGNYSLQINNPKSFFLSIVGDQEVFTVDDLASIINSRILHPMSDYFAESKLSYNDIDANREELGVALEQKIDPIFELLGFTLLDFRIEGTEFDKNTKERINKIADTQAVHYAASQVGVSYRDMRQLDALDNASSNEGGMAGMFMGANAGGMLSSSMGEPFKEKDEPVKKTVLERLTQLKSLHDLELISVDEYEKKKQAILEEI
jgi:membrane protease subunit (stomatin/prohibitin family)